MSGVLVDLFDTVMAGTSWTVRGGVLVVEGVDYEAEVALVGFGGGSRLVVNLFDDVSVAVGVLGLHDGEVLLPAMREAARILSDSTAEIPEDVGVLTLWLLSTTQDAGLAERVAAHRLSSGPVLERVAERWVAGAGGRHVALTERAWRGGDVAVAVASHPATPARLLSAFASSENESIREAAAGNVSTPFRDLRRLMVGPPGRAREIASRTVELLGKRNRRVGGDESLPFDIDSL